MSEKTAVQIDPAKAPPATGQEDVAELQVSAHLMTLDKGLFCVFQTPGSPQSDPATGLPGVRITPAPGTAGRPEAVSVSTFREDGWLNGTAALVRVTDESAQITVTVYQLKGMDAAPRLQVLRLSEETAGAIPRPYRNVEGEPRTDIDDAQAALSADIDAILKRLEEGTPRLSEDMKAVQSSLRRPLAV